MSLENARIIDFRVRVPKALCPDITLTSEEIGQYEAVLDVSSKQAGAQTLDDLLEQMDKNKIDHAIVHAENEVGDVGDALNCAVVDIVNQYPDRFTGIGTVSLEGFSVKKAMRQIDDCIEMGLIGLSLEPAFFGLHLNDKKLYPIYAKAQENNLLIALHTGINYSAHRSMSGENPMLLDEIACDFPDLTIVASHGGWPWVAEMVAVARKHPNIFIEFGGLAPKYVGAQGGGWEMMYRFMNSVLSKQILYGTDYPSMDHARSLAEWNSLNLKPAVLESLMVTNSHALIKKHKPD